MEIQTNLKKTKIYVSGRITDGETLDPREIARNTTIGLVVSIKLQTRDYQVLSPFLMQPYWLAARLSYKEMMAQCLLMIMEADICLFLENWQESAGSRHEYEFAQKINKPCYFNLDEI